MGKEYRSRTFKSGNSVALRLPKGLGIEQGVEMTVREERGQFIVEPARAERPLVDLTNIAGSMPWLKPLPRQDFDDPPRGWHLLNARASK